MVIYSSYIQKTSTSSGQANTINTILSHEGPTGKVGLYGVVTEFEVFDISVV